MGGWMDGSTDGWMNGWMDGWINEWIDGWINEWRYGFFFYLINYYTACLIFGYAAGHNHENKNEKWKKLEKQLNHICKNPTVLLAGFKL